MLFSQVPWKPILWSPDSGRVSEHLPSLCLRALQKGSRGAGLSPTLSLPSWLVLEEAQEFRRWPFFPDVPPDVPPTLPPLFPTLRTALCSPPSLPVLL